MRFVRFFLLIVLLSVSFAQVQAGETQILKVLPQFLDRKGMHTLSPSLYERDAYQKVLRDTPEKRSALRFAVQHTNPKKGEEIKLKVEMRGVKGQELTTATRDMVADRSGMFGRSWTMLKIDGPEYKAFGELTAWRVTLWNGDKQVGEQKSFLW